MRPRFLPAKRNRAPLALRVTIILRVAGLLDLIVKNRDANAKAPGCALSLALIIERRKPREPLNFGNGGRFGLRFLMWPGGTINRRACGGRRRARGKMASWAFI